MNNVISPGERRELRAVVRQRIKVLRADVKQRKAEMVAEAELRLIERYRDNDKAANDTSWRISQILGQAFNDIQDVVDQANAANEDLALRYTAPSMGQLRQTGNDKAQLHRALMTGIDAQVEAAQLALDRQEADLLQTLAMGSLESDAAREFLASIPTAAELVPSTRLRELEAQFDGGDRR